MTVLEYGKDIIIVDCGLGFPEDDMYGVDLVIADMTYLVKNQNRIRGMFLTHGHEDHIGGIPYAMQQFKCPIHATRLTAGLVKLKLEEHHLDRVVQLHTHEAGETVKAGCFQVEFIHVNHSIADAVAFAIKTPVGMVVMTGDFKIDAMAEDGMINLTRFGELGREGVLALLCDSTNVERPGYTPSEKKVAESFERQFSGCRERIIVTTFASNAFRLQSLLTVAHKFGRKVAVTGRSMENILKVSTELGYLKIPNNTLVDINTIKQLPKHKICIVSTGSQGENMSALYRMAFSEHRQVEIQAGDRVVFDSCTDEKMEAMGHFLDYMSGSDVIGILRNAGQGKMSSRASVMADIYSDCTEVKQEEGGYTYAYVKAMETAKPLPTANIHFQDADAMLTDMVTELAQGGDVTEILGKYQEKIQNLYNS